ncbi:DoxX family protein [Amycolatopsis sp. CA-230715]|uniref:DoxX family protein n=1 Tax=Amycolatopsis sp. CA-230715 TaxID=2745196 RepID=UPI001C01010F|nr:DoxX family protein [Amycolatopsis sp. CA-230715]QWF82627.1 hypothetical protein HUW46_06066 [Amycolatopsis sp. CA-230715]
MTDTTTTTDRELDLVTRLRGPVISLTRIIVAALFFCHGLQGFGAFGGVDGQGGSVPLGSWPGWWGSVLELLVAVLVGVGLFTRTAALLGSGVMAYAYFTVHAPMAFLPLVNMGEQAVLYCWVFLLFALIGPGPFAIDALLRRRR